MTVRLDHKMFQTPMMLIFRVYSLRSSAGKVLEDSLPPVRMTGQTQLHCIANAPNLNGPVKRRKDMDIHEK